MFKQRTIFYCIIFKKGYQGNPCVPKENKDSISKQECQANVIYREEDKNCQETPNVYMWPVKPAKEANHIQSVTRSSNRKSVELEILQSSFKPGNPVCSDKNCPHTKFMWPVQPTKKRSCYMQSMPGPAKL